MTAAVQRDSKQEDDIRVVSFRRGMMGYVGILCATTAGSAGDMCTSNRIVRTPRAWLRRRYRRQAKMKRIQKAGM